MPRGGGKGSLPLSREREGGGGGGLVLFKTRKEERKHLIYEELEQAACQIQVRRNTRRSIS